MFIIGDDFYLRRRFDSFARDICDFETSRQWNVVDVRFDGVISSDSPSCIVVVKITAHFSDGASVEVPSFCASYSSSAYLEPVAFFSAFAESISRIALASRHSLDGLSLASGYDQTRPVAAMATCDCAVISTPSRVASERTPMPAVP